MGLRIFVLHFEKKHSLITYPAVSPRWLPSKGECSDGKATSGEISKLGNERMRK